jgi:hypothetical protein
MNVQTATSYTPRFTSNDLSASITERIQELADATDAASMTTEMLHYLETFSKFHQYSSFNVWCILMNCPDATNVAGFQKWRQLNRFVRKGEKGIPILAPMIAHEDPDDPGSNQVLKGFKVVYIYDVSQTEGEDLPEPPNWKSPEQNAVLSTRLVEFANQHGISVEIKDLGGNTQGLSKGGSIVLDPAAGTKTLIHEIAHELMHRDSTRPDDADIRELEAESVAFVVGKHFGLESIGSPNYVALRGVTSRNILSHMDRISQISAEIITAIEGNIQIESAF